MPSERGRGERLVEGLLLGAGVTPVVLGVDGRNLKTILCVAFLKPNFGERGGRRV